MPWLRAALAVVWAAGMALAALPDETPVGVWKTVDDKSGKVRSNVEIYEQDGKLFGKILSIPDPDGPDGRPKICIKCPGADKDKPIVGLVIIRNLTANGDRYTGGTIMDPEEGKVYRAEIWVENGRLRVRGYLGPFYRTQTWLRGS